MLIRPQSFEHMAAFIRLLACSDGVTVTFTQHARRRMTERRIEYSDVLYVLKRCVVSDERLEKGEWVYNAEGKNVDGEMIEIAVVPYREQRRLKIVSTWKP